MSSLSAAARTARVRIDSWWNSEADRRTAVRTRAARALSWLGDNGVFLLAVGAVLSIAFGLLYGVVYLLWLIFSGIGHGLSAAGSWMSGTAAATPGFFGDIWHSVTTWEITRSVTEPVRHYLDQHAAHLPATAGQVWTAGLITAAVLLFLAWTGSWGARIGWLVLGAATIAAAHAGAPAAGAGLSAGITAVAWGALSILAFTGAGRRRPHNTYVTVDARHTATDSA